MNLIEGIQAECNRLRDVVIPQYQDPALKGAGEIAIALMRIDIEEGEASIASGDVVRMLSALTMLKENGK